MAIRRNLFAAVLLCGSTLHAQQINLSLHATAVPDSFEVRATSTGADITGVLNGVFSIRWEVSSGGVMNNSDVRRSCGAYSFFGANTTTVDVGPYRYFTVVFFGERPLEQASCPITSTGMVLGRIRIRQSTGCHNVALVQNAYTGMNNLDYYVSVNGFNATGVIASTPISVGDCPPCEPPVITNIAAAPIPYCGVGVDMSVTATGQDLDYAWQDQEGDYLGWFATVLSPYAPAGTYMVVVSNVCGADTAWVEAVVDPDLCEPPSIDSAWYNGWSNIGYPSISLQTIVSDGCGPVKWITPWGSTHYESAQYHNTQIGHPLPGTYTAILTNACGSDTLELVLGPPPNCSLPVITSATISASDLCATASVSFAVTVAGLPNPHQTWYGPNGAPFSATGTFTTSHAPWGNFTLVVSNFCGNDTAIVYHAPTDTTGLGACLPPEIIAVSVAPNACLNDTIQLIANFTNSGLCAQTTWSNITVLSTQGDTITAVASSTYPVRLTLTNACGQATMDVPIDVWYSSQLVHKLCRPVTVPLDLDSMLHTAFAYTGGQWYLNGQLHGPFYDPAVDTSGTYYYHLSNDVGVACAVVEMIVIEYRPDYGGLDTTITVCSSDPPFALFPMMAGSPHPGGHWSYAGSSVPGQFVPGSSPPGVYRYGIQSMLSGGGCYYYSDMTINVDSALLWYADIDDDGLGDPLDSVLSCDPVDGFVLVAGDACPQLVGTVGDPCDDGDPTTQADVITEACVCSGAVGIGMAELQGGALLLWPNPNRGDVFHLRTASSSGVVRITITDATGRVVRQVRMSAAAEPLEVRMPSGTAAGTYFVGVVDDIGSAVLRLVVE